jgi:hypothetical protein
MLAMLRSFIPMVSAQIRIAATPCSAVLALSRLAGQAVAANLIFGLAVAVVSVQVADAPAMQNVTTTDDSTTNDGFCVSRGTVAYAPIPEIPSLLFAQEKPTRQDSVSLVQAGLPEGRAK